MNHCQTCQRHFFASETTCPFCLDGEAHRGQPRRRAVVAGAAALIVAGCISPPMPVPVYGAPVPPVPSPSVSASPHPTP